MSKKDYRLELYGLLRDMYWFMDMQLFIARVTSNKWRYDKAERVKRVIREMVKELYGVEWS